MAVGTGNAAYRMTEGLGFDYAGDTVDSQHLNVCGAEKGTRHFGSHLKEQYVLPDHRGEEAYASLAGRTENYLDSREKNAA